MLKMQYKSFVWPNNPKTYTLSCERQTAVQKIPMGGFTAQDLGRTCMVLRGEGEFFGKSAMQSFQALVRVFCEDGAGVLLHPAWQGAEALFTQLRLTQEPRENYVAYRFEFCEKDGQEDVRTAQKWKTTHHGGENKVYYTVSGGENLWQICADHALTMQELLERNPSIASPTELGAGERIRIR